jgi:hypothetical protein
MVSSNGLAADGVSLNTHAAGACQFTSAGLDYGNNVLNVRVLQSLARAVAARQGASAPDAPTVLGGMGTSADPFVIPFASFAHQVDTTAAAQSEFDEYSGCFATQNESGPEYVYQLTLEQATPLRILVLSEAGADLDIHLLDGTLTASGCLRRDNRMIQGTLGSSYLSIAAPGSRWRLLAIRCMIVLKPLGPRSKVSVRSFAPRFRLC